MRRGFLIGCFCLLLAASPVFSGAAEENSQQIVSVGGSVPQDGSLNADGVSVKKTVHATERENMFEIRMEVVTTLRADEIIQAQNTAVVVVMDQSYTMNAAIGTGTQTRLQMAKTAAKEFLRVYGEEEPALGVSRELGFVTFDTHAYTVIPLQQTTDAGLAAWESAIDGIETAAQDSHDRFTNIEGGLRLADNLLQASAVSNKYVILLTDGFPTTYVKGNRDSLSKIVGYDPYGSYHYASGEDGYFYDAVEEVVCTATSYSDTAAKKARSLAEQMKERGVHIFSVGIDIGGQTIQSYIDTGKAAGISIVERDASGTYAIGDPMSTDSYKRWLGSAIGGGSGAGSVTYCDGDDLAALRSAYETILEQIRIINEQSIQNAWVASDPMGEQIEFLTFLNRQGTDQGDTLVGNAAAGGESTAAFADGAIRWDLKSSGYTIEPAEDGSLRYRYLLHYRIRLKNEMVGFSEKQPYATNGSASLAYRVLTAAGLSAEKRIAFPEPQVLGYLGMLDVQKIDAVTKAPLSGAAFRLTHDAGCSVCGGTVPITAMSAVSDADGRVLLERIPSGHIYDLEETAVPSGYQQGEIYALTVSYGQTMLQKDGEGITTLQNEPLLTPTPPVIPDPPLSGEASLVPSMVIIGVAAALGASVLFYAARRRHG